MKALNYYVILLNQHIFSKDFDEGGHWNLINSSEMILLVLQLEMNFDFVGKNG